MRKTIMLALVLALVPAAVVAQAQRGPGARMHGAGRADPARALIERRADLNLTDEQVGTLEELSKQWQSSHEAMRAEMQKLRDAGSMRDLSDEQRTQLRALRDRTADTNRGVHEAIRSALTEEQRQKVGSRMRGQAEMRARRGTIGPRGPGAMMRRAPTASGRMMRPMMRPMARPMMRPMARPMAPMVRPRVRPPVRPDTIR